MQPLLIKIQNDFTGEISYITSVGELPLGWSIVDPVFSVTTTSRGKGFFWIALMFLAILIYRAK